MSLTIGEAMARRKLEKTTINNKMTSTYVKGQHKASKLTDTDAMLSYVDRAGAVIIMPVERIDGTWKGKGVTVRCTTTTVDARSVPRGNVIVGDELVRALQLAFKEEMTPPPAD